MLGVSWHEGGRMFASCSHDGLVLLWRTDVGSPVMVLKAHESIVYHCQYLPNSNRCVAAASRGSATLQGHVRWPSSA